MLHILQPFYHFTYVTVHSPTLPLLYPRHSSFSNSSVASSTAQLILQPFRCFTYVTAHSSTILPLLQRHRLFTYVTWLILQTFRHLTYVTAHFPTLPSLYLRHSSFFNHSVALSTSQFILQPSFRFSYVTGSSLNTPGEPPKERTIMAGEHTWY